MWGQHRGMQKRVEFLELVEPHSPSADADLRPPKYLLMSDLKKRKKDSHQVCPSGFQQGFQYRRCMQVFSLVCVCVQLTPTGDRTQRAGASTAPLQNSTGNWTLERCLMQIFFTRGKKWRVGFKRMVNGS